MPELKKVWVTDTRHPDKPAFLYAEHLLKHSKYLKKSNRPKAASRQQTRVTEPEVTANTTSKKKEEK